VMAMGPRALLHSQVTQVTGDRVFVLPQSAIALVCSKPDGAALDKVLHGSIGIAKTGNLDPLRMSAENGIVELSRIASHTPLTAPAVLSGEAYAASYEHAAEWPRYRHLFGVLDHKNGDAPAFFSDNIRSLGDSLYRIRRVSVIVQLEGQVTRDTVRYEFLAK
jgi:hypothetical protein